MNNIPSKFNLGSNIIVHRHVDELRNGDNFLITREIEPGTTACETFFLDNLAMAGSLHNIQTFIAEEVSKHVDIMMTRLTSGYAI